MKLPGIAKRHERKTDDELRSEISELESQERERQRTHTHFRERSHAAVDGSIANAAAELRRRLRHRWSTMQGPLEALPLGKGEPSELERLASLAAAAKLDLAEEWHAAVDEVEVGFSTFTLAEAEEATTKSKAAVASLKAELRRRGAAETEAAAAAEREAAEHELAALEQVS